MIRTVITLCQMCLFSF